jgi:hypothetical protein
MHARGELRIVKRFELACRIYRHHTHVECGKDTNIMSMAVSEGVGLSAPAAFPWTQVEARLHDELIAAVQAEAAVKQVALPATATGIAAASFEIDSLVVVSILCTVEPLVGFELPDSVVRAGGYSSVGSALEHLLPRIDALWTKKKGGKP